MYPNLQHKMLARICYYGFNLYADYHKGYVSSIAIEQKWSYRIIELLDVPVEDDDRISPLYVL